MYPDILQGKILPAKTFNKNNNKITFLNISNENNIIIEHSWIFKTTNIGNLKKGYIYHLIYIVLEEKYFF